MPVPSAAKLTADPYTEPRRQPEPMPRKYSDAKGEPESHRVASVSLSVKLLRSAAEVLQHRFLWEKWSGTRDSDLDFVLHVISARSEVISPYVLVAYRNDLPDAVLIGRLERRRVPVRFGYLQRPTPRLRVLNFVYGSRKSAVLDIGYRSRLRMWGRGWRDPAQDAHWGLGRRFRPRPRPHARGLCQLRQLLRSGWQQLGATGTGLPRVA